MCVCVEEMCVKVVEVEVEVLFVMVEVLCEGNIGVMDYMNIKNIDVDIEMCDLFGKLMKDLFDEDKKL